MWAVKKPCSRLCSEGPVPGAEAELDPVGHQSPLGAAAEALLLKVGKRVAVALAQQMIGAAHHAGVDGAHDEGADPALDVVVEGDGEGVAAIGAAGAIGHQAVGVFQDLAGQGV